MSSLNNPADSANSESGHHPISFLSAVARAYVSTGEDLSEICFLFPNKRAGTFFLNALSAETGGRAIIAPQVMAMPELMARLSRREVTSRIDLLFRLYNVYCRLMNSKPDLDSGKGLLNFDRFAPWGETVTTDFNEVDKYAADAAKLFQNVVDFRDISSNFLTDTQLDVIEEYFGYRPSAGEADRFWKTVEENYDKSAVKERFVELWRVLPQLYTDLKSDLEKDGLTMEGTSYLQAVENVEQMIDTDNFSLPWRRIVFVGFNRLSTTEAQLMKLLGSLEAEDGRRYAEFFWDATGPVLSPDSDVSGAATASIRRNIRKFPAPAWALPYLALSDVADMPKDITIDAAPSNAAQVKIAAMEMEEWLAEGTTDIADAKTAVVIPDENLLLPLIHSLPPDIGSVNLTMGYSLRYTSTASFIYHLRRLHMRRRSSAGEAGYYSADFRVFMSHPLVHAVVGTVTANAILKAMGDLHLRVVTPAWIASRPEEGAEILARILRPLDKKASVDETIGYILEVLGIVDEALLRAGKATHTVNTRMERIQLAHYRRAVLRLHLSVRAHGISMHFANVFHLVDRLLAGEKVTLEGEPLQGLQIMGLLETRALDFERLIVLSMNDRIMPGRSRARTFVPDSLRHAYGLPASNHGEELYAYYFYRMLSRAREVTLIYDARAGEGMRSGGKSRFLMQLEMIHARGAIRHRNFSFNVGSTTSEPGNVEKTPGVMERLDDFLSDDPARKRNLSASALMNFVRCPVWFYYKNVVGLHDEDQSVNYIDSITMGNIVHKAMLQLYFPPDKWKVYIDSHLHLDAAALDDILNDEDRIMTAVCRAINEEHYHLKGEDLDRPLTGSVEMSAEHLARMVRNAVECDRMQGYLELVGGEVCGQTKWIVPAEGDLPALSVNMKYAIDRIDKVDGRLRIVDYKSGKAEAQASGVSGIFEGEEKSKYVLQLLTYAHLLEQDSLHGTPEEKHDIKLSIFNVNEDAAKVEVLPKIGKAGRTYITREGHRDVSDEFKAGFNDMLRRIFSPDEPFRPTTDEENCRICKFKYLCGRR